MGHYMEEETTLMDKQIGSYRLMEKIGSGNFGTVYQAQHILTHHTVAFKVLHLPASEQERFMQEAQFAQKPPASAYSPRFGDRSG